MIVGEAKSAGTILALSGDNLFMSDTGSLGPIDAQVKIGRSMVSAYDYKAWVDEKKEEAKKNGRLNAFDAIMVAQISPGEINGVVNSLKFAQDLVAGWLEQYKFKNWTETETNHTPITQEMKRKRAEEVSESLCDHMSWRSHGRSLKIEDLNSVLKIERVDDTPELADILYRIKTVIRLIFDSSTDYIEETNQFINETRQGKYSDPSCQIQQWQEMRYDYSIVEDINRVNESVMLYGLTR